MTPLLPVSLNAAPQLSKALSLATGHHFHPKVQGEGRHWLLSKATPTDIDNATWMISKEA
ncbi:hypothetical protein [Rhizobium leguminosarum]|uniref:hypothetical protein n=1 Tax=Rhizobium leguminosarum TaxID=384 RepID=UPI0015C14DE8|nr:hypothetical protein [Rhizobium leguminosarum]